MSLSALAPMPAPFPLPEGYDRHAPSPQQTADAMWTLAGQRDWGGLSWPDLVESLVALWRTDVPLGRLVEGHIDALRIHAEAGHAAQPDQLYAVWASRSHTTGISAHSARDTLVLSGTLRFASGAGVVDRALVPVSADDGRQLLLDVDVAAWPVDESAWRTTAMAVSRSHTITLSDVVVPAAAQVGGPGFYLDRPGFFAGGVGVAAVWVGGAARLADLALDYARLAPPSPVRSAQLGRIRTELAAAHTVVRAAGEVMAKAGPVDDRRALATETRAAVAGSARRLIEQARDLAGPAGIAMALDLTRCLDDLDLFVRQQNSGADAEFLGDLDR